MLFFSWIFSTLSKGSKAGCSTISFTLDTSQRHKDSLATHHSHWWQRNIYSICRIVLSPSIICLIARRCLIIERTEWTTINKLRVRRRVMSGSTRCTTISTSRSGMSSRSMATTGILTVTYPALASWLAIAEARFLNEPEASTRRACWIGFAFVLLCDFLVFVAVFFDFFNILHILIITKKEWR